MTLKNPIQEMVKLVSSLRSCGKDNVDSVVVSKREMVMDEKVYVAVTGRELESKSSLVWAKKNTGAREFCIVYVMQISASGAMVHEQKLRKEKEKAHNNLDKYLTICRQMNVKAEKIYIEMESVEEGILQLISQRGVKKLVMGAAADRHYTMRMRDLQSKKAIYISRKAPDTCHIWFTCNGYLICTRGATRRDNLYGEGTSSSSLTQTEITNGFESVPSSSMAKDDVQIQVALIEAASAKRETRLEVSRREEAERSAIDAMKRAKEFGNGYINEVKRRKETEKELNEVKEELEKIRSEAETRMAKSNIVIRKLQGKYSSAMNELRRLRGEQEALKRELSEVSKLKTECNEEEASPSKDREPPQYFLCPITKDVMKDPYVAADGFTYEGEAIRGWFNRKETSPMTNRRLPHTSLVPNLALRSAIQEWLQASGS